jgi:hypothetical protein
MKEKIKKTINILAGVISLTLLICLFIPNIIEFPKLDYSSAETIGFLFGDIAFLILIIWIVKKIYKEIKK